MEPNSAPISTNPSNTAVTSNGPTASFASTPPSPSTIELLNQLLDEIYHHNETHPFGDEPTVLSAASDTNQNSRHSPSSSSSSSAAASPDRSPSAASGDSSSTWTTSSCRESSTGTRIFVSPSGGYTLESLKSKTLLELRLIINSLEQSLCQLNLQLIEQLQERDDLRRDCHHNCDLLTAYLKANCAQKDAPARQNFIAKFKRSAKFPFHFAFSNSVI